MRRKPEIVRGHVHVGIDAAQVGRKSVHLGKTYLIDKVLLAIEIRGLDDVKIGEDQMSHANTSQGHRNGRAQSPRTGDADRRPFHLLMYAGGMAGGHQRFQFGGIRNFATPYQHHPIRLIKRAVLFAIIGKAVDDKNVGIRLPTVLKGEQRHTFRHAHRFFIDKNVHCTPSAFPQNGYAASAKNKGRGKRP